MQASRATGQLAFLGRAGALCAVVRLDLRENSCEPILATGDNRLVVRRPTEPRHPALVHAHLGHLQLGFQVPHQQFMIRAHRRQLLPIALEGHAIHGALMSLQNGTRLPIGQSPYRGHLITAGRGQLFAVLAQGEGVNGIRMGHPIRQRFALGQRPLTDRTAHSWLAIGGVKRLVIRRERQRRDASLEGSDLAGRFQLGVPESHRTVIRRRQPFTIGTPRQRLNGIAMPFQRGEHGVFVFKIMHRNAIGPTHGETLAIGRHGQGQRRRITRRQ